jgi:hypothetical protein
MNNSSTPKLTQLLVSWGSKLRRKCGKRKMSPASHLQWNELKDWTTVERGKLGNQKENDTVYMLVEVFQCD